MFRIEINEGAKRYNREVIFKNLSYTFQSQESYGLIGPNGSGKSTLLKIISGFNLLSRGSINHYQNQQQVEPEEVYRHVAMATPYMELIEEFTLTELLQYHFKFRHIKDGQSTDTLIEKMGLTAAKDKYIKNFSSGMRQRVKLGLCFFSQSAVVLLDEPTTNLDEKGVEWYLKNVNSITDQLLIIASNQKQEYQHCKHTLKITDFK